MSFPRTHPGKILWQEFMKPEGITIPELAESIGVAETDVRAVIDSKTGISDIMAIRQARHFNTSQLFWLDLQTACDRNFKSRS